MALPVGLQSTTVPFSEPPYKPRRSGLSPPFHKRGNWSSGYPGDSQTLAPSPQFQPHTQMGRCPQPREELGRRGMALAGGVHHSRCLAPSEAGGVWW